MDGAAEFQIAAEAHGHAVEAALLAVNGQKVGQRLGGMVVAAVAGVDDGHGGFHGRDHRRALLEVAHGDNVGVAADHAARCQTRSHPWRRGAVGRVGKADDVAAQLVHGGLEAQARARGRLEEQRRQLFARALVGIVIGMGDDVVGGGEQLVDLRGREVENVDQMLSFRASDPALVAGVVAEGDQPLYVLGADVAASRRRSRAIASKSVREYIASHGLRPDGRGPSACRR